MYREDDDKIRVKKKEENLNRFTPTTPPRLLLFSHSLYRHAKRARGEQVDLKPTDSKNELKKKVAKKVGIPFERLKMRLGKRDHSHHPTSHTPSNQPRAMEKPKKKKPKCNNPPLR